MKSWGAVKSGEMFDFVGRHSAARLGASGALMQTVEPARKFGLLKGKVKIERDFDASLSDDILARILAPFEGR